MKQRITSQSEVSDLALGKIQAADFRLYLQNELVERCKKNKAYSLRAFARFLGLDASTLSQILRGKRTLAQKSIIRLASRVGLGPDEMAQFLKSYPIKQSKSAHELTLDIFRVIADWYHFAIFELVTTKGFRADPKWISKSLGITVSEAHIAIERLQRLELIEVDPKGRWHQGADLITTTGNAYTATAFRKLQKQVLEHAIVALEETPIELRDQSSMTMAIHKRRLPEAKERIKKFRRELCEFLQQDKERNSVYQLGVSFYPLTKIQIEKEEV